jgi:hypothetical protein
MRDIMASGAERDYFGKDQREWLTRYGHRDRVTSHVQFLHWLHGADNVAEAGLHTEWEDGSLRRVHMRSGDREVRVSFVPQKSFMTISEMIEDTVVSLDFNKPDKDGNVYQDQRLNLQITSPDYTGATMCAIRDDGVEWEPERLGHILSSIDTDRDKNNVLVVTRHGLVRLPLSANIYQELEQFEGRLS